MAYDRSWQRGNRQRLSLCDMMILLLAVVCCLIRSGTSFSSSTLTSPAFSCVAGSAWRRRASTTGQDVEGVTVREAGPRSSVDEERRLQLTSLVRTEAAALSISSESLPAVPGSLDRDVSSHNKYLTSLSSTLLPLYPHAAPILLHVVYTNMCRSYNDNDNDNNNGMNRAVKPNVTTFNIVLSALAKTGKRKEADEFFRSSSSPSSTMIEPDIISYNILLHMHARHENFDKVSRLFYDDLLPHRTIRINLVTCNTVLNALAKENQPRKAERLLKAMESKHGIAPDVVSYSTVIDAYARAGDASKAEALVKGMLVKRSNAAAATNQKDERSDTNNNNNTIHTNLPPRPSIRTFNSVLKAWSRSGESDAAQRAGSLLKLMMEMSSSNNNYVIPKPDIRSFNTVLSAYGHVGDGLGAEDLLNSMLDKDSKITVIPDVVSYNTVMSAYARSGHYECHKDLLRIMHTMEIYNVKMDVWSHTTLVDAYARGGDPHKAEEVLATMTGPDHNITPNVSTYNAVLNAWVKSNAKGSARRAHELLLDMVERDDVRPNVRSYTTVVDGFAKSRERHGPRRAQELLTLMEEHDDASLRPNVHTYTCVINAWGRSEDPRKARRALDLLNHMRYLDMVQPNLYTYNAVLNACAYTYDGEDEERKEEAFRIACLVFDELRKFGSHSSNTEVAQCKANHVTYGTFLRVIARLMPKGEIMERRTLVEAIFRKCCQEGQVGRYVLDQLLVAAPKDLYWALLSDEGDDVDGDVNNLGSNRRSNRSWRGDETVSVNDLPKKWTRNVRERRR